MKKQNNVFWQALLITIVVFIIGIYLGSVLEKDRYEKINDYYVDSEVSMMDILALNNLIDLESDCELLKEANFNLVNKVYDEAILLEKYDSSGKMTDAFNKFHKKYDILRTYLLIDAMKIQEKCNNFDIIIYLYNNSESDLQKKAEMVVWSNLLSDIKLERGSSVLLIPISVDSNLISLNSLINKYEIENYPAVIVNEEYVFDSLSTKEGLEVVLN